MPSEAQHLQDVELQATVDRLRHELRQSGRDDTGDLRARRDLDRLWAVSADRPFLSRPGAWGRLRGLLLRPPKAVLRRMMRWYVEPLAMDQRQFNAGLLRLVDELAAELARLREQLERLESGNREAESDGPRPSR
jgi:hypothetical protein